MLTPASSNKRTNNSADGGHDPPARLRAKQAKTIVAASGMQRRLEVFLTTDELADPDLVEFWLPDQPEADVPHQQAELATGQRPTDASTMEQQLQHCEALESATHQRNITGALELAAATNDARRKWAEAAAALDGSW